MTCHNLPDNVHAQLDSLIATACTRPLTPDEVEAAIRALLHEDDDAHA